MEILVLVVAQTELGMGQSQNAVSAFKNVMDFFVLFEYQLKYL
jgi:hypothetical protein